MPDPTIDATSSAARPSIDVTWRRFRIRSALSEQDMETAQRLRHEVFHAELLGAESGGVDQDDFDSTSDHMLISNAHNGELIGTCRFRCSRFTDTFYTAGEFTIAGFLQRPGTKVEMGRACIRQSYRNNLVIAALGQVIGAYARSVEARWFFGCSSVLTTDPTVVAGLTAWLKAQESTLTAEQAAPRSDHALPGLDARLGDTPALADDQAHELIPPLLKGYLRAGALVSEQPAYDPDFRCVDYFTALDLSRSNSAFLGRYLAPSPC